ncbi:hypothetical protein [Cryobacterium sp. Hh38]|uniref:hypothetical protein n=1 Tax=Cryobacterium sp. Hh38 TaxID=1259156 RepID=UPI00141A9FB4|nr:hypothetical protein [Cryobacterium sp. Hh38]
MTTHDDADSVDDAAIGGNPIGGDPACWLEQVCPDCGAFVPGELPATCWRCDTLVAPS